MNDYFVSLIRTWVPVGVGSALAWLAATLGIVIDDNTSVPLTVGAVGIVIGVYYAVARAVEHRWPGVGQLLLALGLAGKKTPVYSAVKGPGG